jgi:hypothetical protein
MALFTLLFLGAGARMAWLEHRRLATYRPVAVTVVRSGVEESRDGDGVSYRPVVLYHYTVAGLRYTSDRVTALGESRSGRWAQTLAARYTPALRYVGYYDPARPGHSFLVRERSGFPFGLMGMSGMGLLLLAWAWKRGK